MDCYTKSLHNRKILQKRIKQPTGNQKNVTIEIWAKWELSFYI